MLKNFAFLTVTGLLASACVIDIGDTLSASDTNNGTTTTEGSTSTSSTTGSTSTTEGTSTQGTTTQGTTTSPTTGPTTTDATTGTSTQGTTTSGGTYGKCGWHMDKYYACESGGGVPGDVDPDGVSPIDCPDPLPAEGDKCDETTPVNFVGCCLPDGTNWYCSGDGMVVKEACGA